MSLASCRLDDGEIGETAKLDAELSGHVGHELTKRFVADTPARTL